MIYTPVGVRCADCARLRPLPQFVLTPRTYARIIPVALVVAFGLGFLLSFSPVFGFFGGIIVGIVVGEALRRASGYKQGREIELIAGATVVLTIIVANVVFFARSFGLAHLGAALAGVANMSASVYTLIGTAIGVYVAVQRMR